VADFIGIRIYIHEKQVSGKEMLFINRPLRSILLDKIMTVYVSLN